MGRTTLWLAGFVPTLPMFPLGAVLFPHMPLRLRVFEQRYLIMLNAMLRQDSAEFGVVLIERGQEVGGGEQRFDFGTVAEIISIGAQEGFLGLVAEGRRRFRVREWLPDEPHPKAEVEELAELDGDGRMTGELAETEQLVRRTLALASEFSERVWPSDIELSDDPVTRAWQLAGIAPLGPLDQLALLQVGSLAELLGGVRLACEGVAASYEAPPADQDPFSSP